MKFNLKSMSRKELEKLRNDVETALNKLTDRERKAALMAAEKAAKAHGFSLSEITGDAPAAPKRKPAKKAKAPAAAKNANPENASQTWSGRGRQPAWFKAAMDAGTKPDQMLI